MTRKPIVSFVLDKELKDMLDEYSKTSTHERTNDYPTAELLKALRTLVYAKRNAVRRSIMIANVIGLTNFLAFNISNVNDSNGYDFALSSIFAGVAGLAHYSVSLCDSPYFTFFGGLRDIGNYLENQFNHGPIDEAAQIAFIAQAI